MKRITQEAQVIQMLKREGGYATLKRLNEIVDFSLWKTKTPEATIRRIVQESKEIFKIQPGLWALEEQRDNVLSKFNLELGNKHSEEVFTHSYYQGLVVEIGKFYKKTTYIPTQDKNRKFIDKKLIDVVDTVELPPFSYENLLKRARTVDVIWFNNRKMPSDFYEIEHTTDIKNSLTKFYELQDFNARFFIVADVKRKKEFEDKLSASIFKPIEKRVSFLEYERVAGMHTGLTKVNEVNW